MTLVAFDFKKFFYSSPIPSCVIQDNHFSLINRKLAEAIGYTKKELLKIPFAELIYPDDRSWVLENALSRLAGKKMPASYEFRIFTRRGEIACVSGFFTLIEYNNQPAIFAQYINLNKQKTTENELTEREKRYRLDLSKQGKKEQCCLEFIRKGEKRLFAGFKTNPLFNDEGNYEGTLAEVTGITRRKQVEEALAKEWEVSGALADLSKKLLSPSAIEDISYLVLEHGKRLTGSKYGYVGHIDRQKGHLICSTLTRDIGDVCRIKDKNIVFKRFEDLGGWVVKNKKPVLTNALQNDPRSAGTPPGHIPINRFLSVPAVSNGQLLGIVSLANSDRDYSEQDLNLVERLADIYANAVQRRLIEEELRQSEEKHRPLFETMTQGVVYQNAVGEITSVNPAAEKILGSPFNVKIGCTYLDLHWKAIHEDGSDFPGKEHPPVVALKTGKQVRNVVMGVYNPVDGEHRWIKINAIPQFRPGEDKPYQVYTTFDDITELKVKEEELRAAHQQLLDIIESLPDATFVVDKDKKVIAWNQCMEELTGVRKEDVIGRGDHAYAVPLYGKKRPVMIDLVFGEDRETESRYDYVKKEGNTVYAEVFLPYLHGGRGAYLWGKISKIYDKDGNVIGAIESLHDITERKKAEEALVTERQRFETLIEEAPFGMALFNKDGDFKYISTRFKEIFGYDLSDIPDREEWFRMVYRDADYRQMVLSKWEGVINNTQPGERNTSVFNVSCKDGKEKMIRFTPVKLPTDEFMMTYEDITLGKQIEEELLRIKKAVESSGNAIWMTDKKGKRVIYQNESFIKLMGYSAEEFNAAGGAPAVYLNSETARKVYDTIINGCFWKGEIELRTRDDKIVPVYLNCDAVRNEEGEIIAIFGICNDITKRKLAEQKLRTANQQLLDTINFLPDATFVIDRRGKVIAWNKAIEKMTGVRKEDIMGKGDYAYAVPFYGEARPILIDMIIHKDSESELRYGYIERKENTIYGEAFTPSLFSVKEAYLWGKASPLFDSEGNLIGAIESIRDITERKRTEEQLKYLSLHDPLTGLYNRTFFEEGMRRAGDGRFDPVGIIVCDLDGLKFVNDTLGHETGDSLLIASANVINSAFRKSDIVARIGGDEFAILLTQSDEKTVEEASNRIRDAINKYNAASPEIPLSISIGFSVKSETSEAISNLFKEADNNMYREKLHRGQSPRSAIVQTLMKALEARDFITEGHAVRLQDYVTVLAESVGMPSRNISELNLLAKFHDIGKVGVPDRILFKPGPLNSEEAAEMRRHCEIGHRIAQSAPALVPIADWILKHHEWWNGKGYPLGLIGEEIPLECRILAIGDAYDAMTSDRPYRKALTCEKAVEELKNNAGVQFDPNLVLHFLELLENNRDLNS